MKDTFQTILPNTRKEDTKDFLIENSVKYKTRLFSQEESSRTIIPLQIRKPLNLESDKVFTLPQSP